MGAPGNELLLQSPRLDVHVGGAEANVGVSLARFGHDVAMASTVADNPLGAHALGELRRHGVDTRGVRLQADGRMGLYFLTTGAVQRASEVVYDRADSAFALSTAADYDWPALLQTIAQTGATRIIATHGNTDALIRNLRENGTAAEAFRTDYGSEE